MPTSRSNRRNIGITLGDPKGIGAEITAKALSKPSVRNLANFTIIGDRYIFTKYFPKKHKNCTFLETKSINTKTSSGKRSYLYLQKAVELLKDNSISALVTAPVSKESICQIEPNFQGHTEFLANAFRINHVGMLFVAENLRTIIATRHIPLNSVSRNLTKELIFKTITLTHSALKNTFKIKKPCIGICGINPHAGEGGIIGKEEITTVIPAIKKAQKENINCLGPFAADTLFTEDNRKNFDTIIAMYHDQGLIPIKTLYFHELVNLTIGLPFIRTSPAHGTAFNIAGKNKANPSSMIEAIKLAVKLS